MPKGVAFHQSSPCQGGTCACLLPESLDLLEYGPKSEHAVVEVIKGGTVSGMSIERHGFN